MKKSILIFIIGGLLISACAKKKKEENKNTKFPDTSTAKDCMTKFKEDRNAVVLAANDWTNETNRAKNSRSKSYSYACKKAENFRVQCSSFTKTYESKYSCRWVDSGSKKAETVEAKEIHDYCGEVTRFQDTSCKDVNANVETCSEEYKSNYIDLIKEIQKRNDTIPSANRNFTVEEWKNICQESRNLNITCAKSPLKNNPEYYCKTLEEGKIIYSYDLLDDCNDYNISLMKLCNDHGY